MAIIPFEAIFSLFLIAFKEDPTADDPCVVLVLLAVGECIETRVLRSERDLEKFKADPTGRPSEEETKKLTIVR